MNNNAKSRILFNDNELISYFRMLIKGKNKSVSIFMSCLQSLSFLESNIDLSMSDELLMCFIHARKGDVHRAMKLVISYLKSIALSFIILTFNLLEAEQLRENDKTIS